MINERTADETTRAKVAAFVKEFGFFEDRTVWAMIEETQDVDFAISELRKEFASWLDKTPLDLSLLDGIE